MADLNPISLDSRVGDTQPFSKFPNLRYGEKAGYTETYTREGVEVRRVLYTNWQDAVIFPEAMLGDVEPGNGDGSLVRSLPHLHPHITKALYCVGLDLQNAAGAPYKDERDGLIAFRDSKSNLDGLAEWVATYRQLPFDVLPDDKKQLGSELYRFVEREAKYATEGYPVPGLAFQWQSSGLPFPEPMTVRRPLLSLQYTWHWVPEPMPKVLSAVDDGQGNQDHVVDGKVIGKIIPKDGVVIGRLNHDTFDVGNHILPAGFAPGHLLCGDVETSGRLYTPSGRPVRNIIYSLHYRPDSRWDAFWNQALGKFDVLQPREYVATVKVALEKGGRELLDNDGKPILGAGGKALRYGTMKVHVKGRRPYEPGNFPALFGYRP